MALKKCDNCDDFGWVCENHKGKPWGGTSSRHDACECGAGAVCPVCVPAGELPDSDRYMAEVICSVWDDEVSPTGTNHRR